ncbi:VOC family protein [Pseudomonas sp. COR18]|uniref:VOC family protein n=1 Tax=Pseudomonas sp. COR18 TaxID=3399680 RepID=UPI003B00F76E
MNHPNLFLLYVQDPQKSRVFYEDLLGIPPEAAFPNYVSFSLKSGVALGLWSTSAQDFQSGGSGHRSEVAFLAETHAQVEALQQQWIDLGVVVEQPLHHAAFGPTFVALDPDGHRLRVCLPDRADRPSDQTL